MAKKNNLGRRKVIHEFDLQREKEAKAKREKKIQKKETKMQVDTKKAGIAKKGKGFLMGKGKKAKLLKALQVKRTGAAGMDVDSKKRLAKKKK